MTVKPPHPVFEVQSQARQAAAISRVKCFSYRLRGSAPAHPSQFRSAVYAVKSPHAALFKDFQRLGVIKSFARPLAYEENWEIRLLKKLTYAPYEKGEGCYCPDYIEVAVSQVLRHQPIKELPHRNCSPPLGLESLMYYWMIFFQIINAADFHPPS